MKKPKVSIISISYNHERYIEDALKGFLLQKANFPIEIIIADDASTDKSQQIIKEYADQYPDIIKPILRKKNVGAINNFIDALDKAEGTYIAICEGDDYWTDPNKLQIQADFLDKNTQFSGCFHTVKVVYEDKSKKSYVFPEVKDAKWYTTEELLRTNYIPTNAVMYRRRDYKKLPHVMPFDWYLHLFHAQDKPLAFIEKTMSVYRKHTAGLWWEYDKNRDKIWIEYGLSYMNLFEEIYKIHGKNKASAKIISASINDLLGTLIATDEKFKTTLFDDAISAYPGRLADFIRYQHKSIENKNQEIEKLIKDLLSVGDERHELQVELSKRQQQLDDVNRQIQLITNSKLWRARKHTIKIVRKVRGTK